MNVHETPVLFFPVFAIGVMAAFGVFACCALLLRRLGLTMTRRGSKGSLLTESEWSLSGEENAIFTKALWGGNTHLKALGVLRLVWATRISFLVVAASVFGCAFTLLGAAE